jgi:hypothetical protein
MQIERAQQMAPTAKISLGNGVQNGVQNDRIRLSRIELDTVGLPVKSALFTFKRWPKTADSDPRLQYVSLGFSPILTPTASKSASKRVHPARNPKNYHRTAGELFTGFVRQAVIWPTYGVRDENGFPALPARPQVLLRAQRDGAAGKFAQMRQGRRHTAAKRPERGHADDRSDTLAGHGDDAERRASSGLHQRLGVGDSRGHGGFVFDRMFQPLLLRNAYKEKNRQEATIRSSSLDWVVVRPGMLTNDLARGIVRAFTDLVGVKGGKVARADVARFAVEQLTTDTWLRQTPVISW